MARAITNIDDARGPRSATRARSTTKTSTAGSGDAGVAEIAFTAFTGRRKAEHVTARLIVRRVRRLQPRTVAAGQSEMFAVYRYHAVVTDSAEPMLAAEVTHRDHAIRSSPS